MDDAKKMTILVVEDDPDLSGNVALILTMEGFDVLTAANGLEGLAAVHTLRPDLILCDILMPGIDGYVFHQKIKIDERLADIPFIFISALNNLDDLRRGMQAGADDYLCKPFSAEQLVAAVAARLERFAALITTPEKAAVTAEQLRRLQSVSQRELQVLLMVAKGKTSRQIADHFCISPKTVEGHRSHLMKKVNAVNAAALVHWAVLADRAITAGTIQHNKE
jgi:DNA-binding NarL/FixJ family response regulator